MIFLNLCILELSLMMMKMKCNFCNLSVTFGISYKMEGVGGFIFKNKVFNAFNYFVTFLVRKDIPFREKFYQNAGYKVTKLH